MSVQYYEGVGRRKQSIARVRIMNGSGRFIVNDKEAALKALKEKDFTVSKTEVVAVEVPDKPGGLAHILDLLDKQGVNVEYMYAFIERSSDNAVIIFRFDENDKAIKALSGAGIAILDGSKVYNL